jgi:uncharacterized protein YijF (DUF1287 family)
LKVRVVIICAIFFEAVVINSSGQSNFAGRLADSALTLTKQRVTYDPGYFILSYPNGDVPADKGVCTDVIIRAYRKMGIDLQKEIHEDMLANFAAYPAFWGLTCPDKNIDHRRVPNLMVFFERHGIKKSISGNPRDYSPGDIVFWSLGRGIKHVGIVAGLKSADGGRYMIIHNIGGGQVIEDILFKFEVIGHFQFGN